MRGACKDVKQINGEREIDLYFSLDIRYFRSSLLLLTFASHLKHKLRFFFVNLLWAHWSCGVNHGRCMYISSPCSKGETFCRSSCRIQLALWWEMSDILLQKLSEKDNNNLVDNLVQSMVNGIVILSNLLPRWSNLEQCTGPTTSILLVFCRTTWALY